ncbi:MAG: hypothetical protein KKE44_24200 [Proteobacteria bacterium]|nr:hypothetical protein [Pseudomonadota bacterium]MBU1585835.1 hypothetical protein [Pseudomonadota bacterium]MBU2453591.1 hypothetical protein [Pseudomonadota bacterium]
MKDSIKKRWIVLLLISAVFLAPNKIGACTWWSIYTDSGQENNSKVLYEQLQKFKITGAQPSGWGYVGYSRQNEKKILEYRSMLSSVRDPNFDNKLNELTEHKPKIVLVHNWLRVTGPAGIPNPYPHKRYINGKWYSLGDYGVSNMSKLFNAIDKKFIVKNPIIYGKSTKKYQMGELWLLLILQEIEANGLNSEIGFVKAIKKMDKAINASLVFSDGTKIWCYSDCMNLYYYYDTRKNYTIISSGAKAGNDIDWKVIPGGQKLLITMNHEQPRIIHIDTYKE